MSCKEAKRISQFISYDSMTPWLRLIVNSSIFTNLCQWVNLLSLKRRLDQSGHVVGNIREQVESQYEIVNSKFNRSIIYRFNNNHLENFE